ncbi:DNA repair protein RadC [Trichococcus patagoniensis]|uniref:DNA repair protein RadC n=1 Tax=Trichococcus patagoniensis TaxID=382641 RepID=A0A2T5IQ66_9LACT|nr:JAB domain-containing protein [Trichococcus patagoniensis]PTQ85956.1 DNA repair protein RadC [Trichococcus patagoniensis]
MILDSVRLELVTDHRFEIDMETNYAFGVECAGEIFSKKIGKSNVENVGLICLDSTNRIINYACVAIGSIESVKVSIAEIFKIALLSNSSQIIIAHNHPSGVLEITEADISLTKKIGTIAKIFDIKLIDSLIVNSKEEVLSIRENFFMEEA